MALTGPQRRRAVHKGRIPHVPLDRVSDTGQPGGRTNSPAGKVDMPSPAGEHHERRVTLAQAEHEAAAWLALDSRRLYEAERVAWRDEHDAAIAEFRAWYYGEDRPWAFMTGQFAAVAA